MVRRSILPVDRSPGTEGEVTTAAMPFIRSAIKREKPMLGQKLLTYFVAVMAERLTFANRTIAVLRR